MKFLKSKQLNQFKLHVIPEKLSFSLPSPLPPPPSYMCIVQV